jgi:hypothetical protein
MNCFQIVPVMHAIGNGDPGNERQTYRKNGNNNRFVHSFSSPKRALKLWIYGYPTRMNIRHSPRPETACQRETIAG